MLSNIENTKNYLYTRLKKIILFLNWDDEFEFGHFIWRYKEELLFFFFEKKICIFNSIFGRVSIYDVRF